MVKILILVVLILVVAYVIVGMAAASRVRKRRAAARKRMQAITDRAVQQNDWFLSGDPRGLYGDYPIPELFPKEHRMSVIEAEHVIHPAPEPAAPKTFTIPAPAGDYSGVRFPASGGTVPFTEWIRMAAPGEIVATVPDELAHLAVGDPVLVVREDGAAVNLDTQRRRAAQMEMNRLHGIANTTHPAGTVIETWGGDIINFLHDKYRQPDTLSVAEAQQQLDETKHQIDWARNATAYQVNAMLAQINAALPRKKPTRPRKPAKRISERKVLEHYVEDLDA
jgi:hypothetical protein